MTSGRKALTPQQKDKLNHLCRELLKKHENLTSGKLQFIGLSHVRKRLGKRWPGLSKIVYATVEQVIDHYISPEDIPIRYRDDVYIIIFARPDENGAEKMQYIAKEIQKRLFDLNETELRDREIRNALREIKSDFLQHDGFDFLDVFESETKTNPLRKKSTKVKAENPNPASAIDNAPSVEVSTDSYTPEVIIKTEPLSNTPHFLHLPLWDVPRNALTTYLCLGFLDPVTEEQDGLHHHRQLYQGLSRGQQLTLDMKTLQYVISQLDRMERMGRKFLLACPVQFNTLHPFHSYSVYKELLDSIPVSQRQFLVFVITNLPSETPPKNAYWFAPALRGFCRHIFAEVPLNPDVNFHYLRNSGIDVVGVKLGDHAGTEEKVINNMRLFGSKAKLLKIPKMYVLGISSLSLTTSAVCSGFDFLGGKAIHPMVKHPESIHRYHHEDLISSLRIKKSSG